MLFTECQTVICLAYPYPLIVTSATKNQARIASYALSQDYHLHISDLVKKLLEKITQLFGDQLLAQVHLDTSPILEKKATRGKPVWAGSGATPC